MVRFMRLNLAEPSYPNIATGTCAFDIILCRNVTIYFDAATTRQVVGRFYDSLVPGGWLIVGHAEPQASVYHQFEVYNFPDTVVYRKPLSAPLFTVDTTLPRSIITTTPKVVAPALPVAPPIQVRAATRPSLPPLPEAVTPPQSAASTIEGEVLLRQARQAADRSEWTEAEQQCVQLIEQEPLRRDAHYLLAQIHEHHGRLDQALASYRRAVYLDRTFVLATIGMAQVWQSMGRIADAQRSYRNALKQLAVQPAGGAVPNGDGVTYGDLRALVMQQLAALERII
jgi:chemotaxis protein methyltransferase CheR